MWIFEFVNPILALMVAATWCLVLAAMFVPDVAIRLGQMLVAHGHGRAEGRRAERAEKQRVRESFRSRVAEIR